MKDEASSPCKDLSSSVYSCRDNSRRKLWKIVDRKGLRKVTVNNANDGRKPKRSEYDCLKKCHNFQWKCQIAAAKNINIPGQKCYVVYLTLIPRKFKP